MTRLSDRDWHNIEHNPSMIHTIPYTIMQAELLDLKKLREDLKEAAGELLVDVPEPGTTTSRLLLANRAMRRERDAAGNHRSFDFKLLDEAKRMLGERRNRCMELSDQLSEARGAVMALEDKLSVSRGNQERLEKDVAILLQIKEER